MAMGLVHRDFAIEFDTATEEWKCGALALADKSLAALKRSIDREGKKRRAVNVDVLFLHERYISGGGRRYELKSATVTLLRENDRQAMIKVAGSREKQQADMSDLYPPSERKKLEAYVKAEEQSTKAQDHATELQEGLTHITGDFIREATVRRAEDES